MDVRTLTLSSAPVELRDAVQEFFAVDEWNNAARVSYLESGWDAFALRDTTGIDAPCGTPLSSHNGIIVTAELSVGWFQINACNFPDWEWQRLYNTRHNVGTAHMLWDQQGWRPWYFSARTLGLL